MSYRIAYDEPERRSYIRFPVLTAMCFVLFLLLVYWRWPEGALLIRSVFLAAEKFIGITALDCAVEALGAGETAAQAFSDFLANLR